MTSQAETIDQLVRSILNELLNDYTQVFSPKAMLQFDAAMSTLAYLKANMQDAMLLKDRYEVLEYALGKVMISGLYLEFGVRSGDTINFIADRASDKKIFGFDSFEGLPDDWQGYIAKKGYFSTDALPTVRSNVSLIKGWFDQTLPDFVAQYDGDVAFLHVDSDLYSSARCIFDELSARIRQGTVIVFDEYFNYPNWQNHEYKAFQEFCTTHSVSYRYIAVGYHQVAVVIEDIC